MSLANPAAIHAFAKRVSASEAKTRFGFLVDWSIQNQREVVVEKHGEPTAVIMPYGDYQVFLTLKQEAERKKALETFHQLRTEVQARNPEMTEKTAQEFASDFASEVIKAVIKKRQRTYG